MKTFPPLRRRSTGFTLIEVMVATSITGVLASVAYPSFSGALHKVHRTEALVAVIQLQQAQERWRSGNSQYGSLAEIGVPSVAPRRNYLLSVARQSATGYEVMAAATGTQASDRSCRYLKFTVDAGNTAYASGDTEAVTNNAQANRQCWNQ